MMNVNLTPEKQPAETTETTEKVVIFGSGPAGLTAAIYCARAGLEPLVFEGIQPGGQLTITTEIENFPGFPEGISGPELMDRMRAQAERFGARLRSEQVVETDLSQGPFSYTIEGGEKGRARIVIIATGATAKYLGLPNEQRLMGRGVSACATCDGFFFRGQDIVVIGGGDTAMEEALFLTHFARSVTIIHRRKELRASKAMQKRAQENEKIHWALNKDIVDVLGEETVKGVLLRDKESGELETIPATGFFLGIGHQPNVGPFSRWLKTNEHGYLVTRPGSAATEIPGVFSCGDVQDPTYRQAITAAGSGCMAAIEAERWLSEQ